MIIEFDPIKNAKNITERGFDFVADFDWKSVSRRVVSGQDSKSPHTRKLENNRTKKPHDGASK